MNGTKQETATRQVSEEESKVLVIDPTASSLLHFSAGSTVCGNCSCSIIFGGGGTVETKKYDHNGHQFLSELENLGVG